jgi:hypothetical protein
MTHFTLPGIREPLPCPHCGKTDCAGWEESKQKANGKWVDREFCLKCKKIVTTPMLIRKAKEMGLEPRISRFIEDWDYEVAHSRYLWKGAAQHVKHILETETPEKALVTLKKEYKGCHGMAIECYYGRGINDVKFFLKFNKAATV